MLNNFKPVVIEVIREKRESKKEKAEREKRKKRLTKMYIYTVTYVYLPLKL